MQWLDIFAFQPLWLLLAYYRSWVFSRFIYFRYCWVHIIHIHGWSRHILRFICKYSSMLFWTILFPLVLACNVLSIRSRNLPLAIPRVDYTWQLKFNCLDPFDHTSLSCVDLDVSSRRVLHFCLADRRSMITRIVCCGSPLLFDADVGPVESINLFICLCCIDST